MRPRPGTMSDGMQPAAAAACQRLLRRNALSTSPDRRLDCRSISQALTAASAPASMVAITAAAVDLPMQAPAHRPVLPRLHLCGSRFAGASREATKASESVKRAEAAVRLAAADPHIPSCRGVTRKRDVFKPIHSRAPPPQVDAAAEQTDCLGHLVFEPILEGKYV